MAEWSIDVIKYIEKKKKQVPKIREKLVWKIFSGVVSKTPVDSGRARGNWQISVGSDNTNVIERTDPSKLGSAPRNHREESKKLKNAKGDDTIYIVNNLPYIASLEYGLYSPNSKTGKTVNGYSKQAPQGMVGLTMANVKKYTDDAVKESEE